MPESVCFRMSPGSGILRNDLVAWSQIAGIIKMHRRCSTRFIDSTCCFQSSKVLGIQHVEGKCPPLVLQLEDTSDDFWR